MAAGPSKRLGRLRRLLAVAGLPPAAFAGEPKLLSSTSRLYVHACAVQSVHAYVQAKSFFSGLFIIYSNYLYGAVASSFAVKRYMSIQTFQRLFERNNAITFINELGTHGVRQKNDRNLD